MLAENRFIHCKEWWPLVAEGLVVEDGLKEPLLAGSSVYQIGGQPSNRSEEHMFVFKSVVAKYRVEGKMVVIQSYDISKFFKASALWAYAFYKSKCPSVCPSVCLCVCSLLRYRLNIFLPPLPEVGCPIFLEIRNTWGKVIFEHI